MKTPKDRSSEEDQLDESLEESFPASDPPAHGQGTPAPGEDDAPPPPD